MSGEPPLPPPPPPPPARTFEWDRYGSPRTHLRVVRVLLGLTSVATAAFVAIAVRAPELDGSSAETARRAGDVLFGAGLVASLCGVATYVALASWCGRMYRNLFALSFGDLRFTPGWGVGAWFVPFLNLVRPKQIVNDLWRATDPDLGPSRSWREVGVTWAVHVWWALLISVFVTGPLGVVVFCGFSWFVTSELTYRMEAFAARRGQFLRAPLPPTGGPTRDRDRTRGPVAVVLLAVVGLVAGAGVPIPKIAGSASLGAVAPEESALEVSAPSDTDAVTARSTSIFEVDVGDCIEPRSRNTPVAPEVGGEVGTVDVVACDVPHTYELIDVVVHEGSSDESFPGTDALSRYGSERCAEHFEGIVGTPFLQSELDVILFTPLEDGWRLGDREILCLAFRMDGRPLDATVVGSGM